MIGIVRMYVYKEGIANVFDFPKAEAKKAHYRLLAEGYTVYHSVLV